MAYILKKVKKTTIRSQMYRYLAFVLLGAMVINGATMLFHVLVTKQYDSMLGQFLTLNQYYVRLKETNSKLETYVQSGYEDDYPGVQSGCRELETILNGLMEQTVSKTFTRDISDVNNQFLDYMGLIQSIHEELLEEDEEAFTTEKMSRISSQYSDTQKLYNYMEQEFKNLNLTLLEFASDRQESVYMKQKLYFGGFLLALLLAVWCSIEWGRHLAGQIAVPIQELTRCAEDIRDGNMSEFQKARIEACSTDEIRILVHVFNMMLQQIEEQIRAIEENAKTRLHLQEKEMENLKITALLRTSELRALQMQMNPHFLFNTLNMIAKTVYVGDSKKTVALIQNTAQLLRYSLDYSGKSVTLALEIEMLGNYVYLQEQRFGERIKFEFDLDERFHNVHIPCLILQPLVENSIIHGVGSYIKDGEIVIRTQYFREEHRGVISILDNGLGMDSEKLAQIRKALESDRDQREKIGLANVYKRLEVFFSGACEMEIYSIPEKETEIRIIIPTEGREKEYVPYDYSG